MGLAELIKGAQNFEKELRRVAVSLRPVIKEIKDEIDDLKTKYEEAYPYLEKGVEEFAKQGWLIPPNMGLLEVFDMVEANNKKLFFERFYENNSNYEEMKQDLLDCKLIDQGLMQECFFCYENEQYKILIPALFVQMEKFLANYLETKSVGGTLSEDFKREIKKRKDNSIVYLQLHAANVFVKRTFKYRDFNAKRLEISIRAWVMHGRDSSGYWTKTEAIRLLNVLYALLFVTWIMEEE